VHPAGCVKISEVAQLSDGALLLISTLPLHPVRSDWFTKPHRATELLRGVHGYCASNLALDLSVVKWNPGCVYAHLPDSTVHLLPINETCFTGYLNGRANTAVVHIGAWFDARVGML
jgi:hypothetical protein